jgi:hypothetical protein
MIGELDGEQSIIYDRKVGELSNVPYAEPTWLSKGYYSPYYSEVNSPFISPWPSLIVTILRVGPQEIPESRSYLF